MQAAHHTAAVVSPYLHAVLPHVSVLIRSGALLQYRNLGEVYGLPKMHYKGKQGDFYIMVCCLLPTLVDPCDLCHHFLCKHSTHPCAFNLGVPQECQPMSLLVMMQVMDLLGPSLWDAWNSQSIDMTPQYVACVAVEAIIILQALHEKGYVTLSDWMVCVIFSLSVA